VLVVEATGSGSNGMKLGKLLAEKTLWEWRVAEGEEKAAVGHDAAQSDRERKGCGFEKGAAEDLAEFVAADLMR